MPRTASYIYDPKQIETWMTEGLTTREIADKIGCSQPTLVCYINRNFDKVVKLVPKKKTKK